MPRAGRRRSWVKERQWSWPELNDQRRLAALRVQPVRFNACSAKGGRLASNHHAISSGAGAPREGAAASHIGGTAPSIPTATNAAVFGAPGFVATNTWAPGSSLLLSACTMPTTGTPAGTWMAFSPFP